MNSHAERNFQRNHEQEIPSWEETKQKIGKIQEKLLLLERAPNCQRLLLKTKPAAKPDEISKEPAAGLSGKLSCNWLIMLVTMATPISSHVKDKNSIFIARDEDMFFLVKGKILVFHQYLYNKVRFQGSLLRVCLPRLDTWPKVRTHCDNGAHLMSSSNVGVHYFYSYWFF